MSHNIDAEEIKKALEAKNLSEEEKIKLLNELKNILEGLQDGLSEELS